MAYGLGIGVPLGNVLTPAACYLPAGTATRVDAGKTLRGNLTRTVTEATMPDRGCADLDAIKTVRQPVRRECEDCVKIGATWVHLRTCQTCGGTRCCDDSPNKHASKHARAIGHPVIASAEPGERWLYCFKHDLAAEY